MCPEPSTVAMGVCPSYIFRIVAKVRICLVPRLFILVLLGPNSPIQTAKGIAKILLQQEAITEIIDVDPQ